MWNQVCCVKCENYHLIGKKVKSPKSIYAVKPLWKMRTFCGVLVFAWRRNTLLRFKLMTPTEYCWKLYTNNMKLCIYKTIKYLLFHQWSPWQPYCEPGLQVVWESALVEGAAASLTVSWLGYNRLRCMEEHQWQSYWTVRKLYLRYLLLVLIFVW